MSSHLTARDRARVQLRVLPRGPIRKQGLLWLPHPYVVPGGRFNEMYGRDSFFTVLGLLRDGELELARRMTENQLYQVRHHGKVLTAPDRHATCYIFIAIAIHIGGEVDEDGSDDAG